MTMAKGGPIRIADAPGAVREVITSSGADSMISENVYCLPGFTDVHVHLREPGFSYKETIAAGSRAAAAGGFTSVMTMPNLDPVPDSREHLKAQTDIIDRDGIIGIYPVGSITEGEKGRKLSAIEELADRVYGFSDDGLGVADEGIMREAMERISRAGSILIAHCEDTGWPRESRDAEWRQLERDLKLAEETGCSYHMCHASTAESVKLLREAKKSGLDVSGETAPHYLLLTEEDVLDEGRFKMNPPIKGKKDREALREAISDGTLDMIATDHAPHSREEKSGGFSRSAFGIVGLETAFPVLYTGLVMEGLLSWERLMEVMVSRPGRRFKLPGESEPLERIRSGDFSLWDLESTCRIDPEHFETLGRSTPFEGREVQGRCLLTAADGRAVWRAPGSKGKG